MMEKWNDGIGGLRIGELRILIPHPPSLPQTALIRGEWRHNDVLFSLQKKTPGKFAGRLNSRGRDDWI